MPDTPMDQLLRRITEKTGHWGRETTLDAMREGFEDLISGGREAALRHEVIGGIPAAWTGAGEGVLLYCHGGGYQMGSLRSHGPLMADLAKAAGVRVLGFDYRLAPEHRYPAAAEDALSVYRALLASGTDPRRLAIAGDSAGAGLALGTLLRARAEGLPLPAAAVFLSPWVDMQARGTSYDSNAAQDPLTQKSKVLAMVRAYLGRGGDPADPLASPVNGDLAGLPEMLIHVGSHETVLGDSELLLERARAAGVSVELVVWAGMVHHFQVFPELPEAESSISQIGAFLRRRIG
ncbi:alpha/beta hydrolase [Falsigemmobacter faecalis]|uniref:Alpha/beta hydrolase n=1 Tax=Falsigemmobacter faecalis TaxID=2488730 RepID=A0A3P3DQG8_9RHOB|nr:alpha/beta hydrolase [Falsigemmobacter faecalis]RRH76184.1 alpha/beta hydrolase [Falsigemmobacter faecalis]